MIGSDRNYAPDSCSFILSGRVSRNLTFFPSQVEKLLKNAIVKLLNIPITKLRIIFMIKIVRE